MGLRPKPYYFEGFLNYAGRYCQAQGEGIEILENFVYRGSVVQNTRGSRNEVYMLREIESKSIACTIRNHYLSLYGHVVRFPEIDPAHQVSTLQKRQPEVKEANGLEEAY